MGAFLDKLLIFEPDSLLVKSLHQKELTTKKIDEYSNCSIINSLEGSDWYSKYKLNGPGNWDNIMVKLAELY